MDLANDMRWPRPLHFVSSSPPQLRTTLDEKLCFDGLDWESDTFKNQLYNVMKGRMDLLRHHVAYKSAAILSIMQQAGPECEFVLIGDNAEWDAYIYLGIALYLQQGLNAQDYVNFLKIAGIDVEVAENLVHAYSDLRGARVRSILIREAPGYQFVAEPTLWGSLYTFANFWQAALQLMQQEVIPATSLHELARGFHNTYGFPRRILAQDLATFLAEAEQRSDIATACKDVRGYLNVTELGMAKQTESVESGRFTHKNLNDLRRLSAADIISHASQWVTAIHAARERGKQQKRLRP